jgi:predicted nicotinamide N-methyase
MDKSLEPKTVTVDEDDYFADVGFMFEAQQPVRYERFDWDTSEFLHTTYIGDEAQDDDTKKRISVALHVADDIPGAVQSGHYLWPAAVLLSKYLIRAYSARKKPPVSLSPPRRVPNPPAFPVVRTVLELGAGCGLASLTALQLWQDTLQCLCLTDHDRGTLVRARDNLETTVQLLVVETNDDDDDDDDERLNAAINSIASIPVLFEMLEWGDRHRADTLLQSVIPERLPACLLISDSEHASRPPLESDNRVDATCTTSPVHMDVVLGSDLIYCTDVVKPLFGTAAHLMGHTGRFILAQSFSYDDATEREIDQVCERYSLQREIIVDFDDDILGKGRIQEFYYVNNS